MYQCSSPKVKKAGDSVLLPTLGGMQQPHLVGQELMEAKRRGFWTLSMRLSMRTPEGPCGGASGQEAKVAASNYFREEESGKQMSLKGKLKS